MMAMDLCHLRFAVICVCRAFLGWLLMSITTANFFQLLTLSIHLPDDLTITIHSTSHLIPFHSILLLMMLLMSLLRRWRLLMLVLLKLLVYRRLRCSSHRKMSRGPNISPL